MMYSSCRTFFFSSINNKIFYICTQACMEALTYKFTLLRIVCYIYWVYSTDVPIMHHTLYKVVPVILPVAFVDVFVKFGSLFCDAWSWFENDLFVRKNQFLPLSCFVYHLYVYIIRLNVAWLFYMPLHQICK